MSKQDIKEVQDKKGAEQNEKLLRYNECLQNFLEDIVCDNLVKASRDGDLKKVQELCDQHEIEEKQIINACCHAVEQGMSDEVVKYFIEEQEVDINVNCDIFCETLDKDSYYTAGDSLLHIAVKNLQSSMVNVLIALGANKAHRNSEGETPHDLYFASEEQNEKVFLDTLKQLSPFEPRALLQAFSLKRKLDDAEETQKKNKHRRYSK